MTDQQQNNNVFLMHLSSFGGYLFPFGSIVIPLVIWETTRKNDKRMDSAGKEVLNFNLSYLLYSLIFVIVLASVGIYTAVNDLMQITLFLLISFAILLGILQVVKFILIITGAVKANSGEDYKYPLTIRFIK